MRFTFQSFADSLPHIPIVSRFTYPRPEDADVLNPQVFFHDYVILHGRRVVCSDFKGYAPDSLVQYQHGDKRWVGEVKYICTHVQPLRGHAKPLRHQFFGVRWFERCEDADLSVWDP